MFDFRRALKSALAEHPDDTILDLLTPWGEKIDSAHVLQEYPRPQLRRESYVNLNGLWDYRILPAQGADDDRDGGSPVRQSTAKDATEPRTSMKPDLTCARMPDSFNGTILVPFSPEALLSGVKRQLQPDELLWYHRTVNIPDIPAGHRLLLHFEAVDDEMACFVDGSFAGTHSGGYLPFSFDITELLPSAADSFELAICVSDPSDMGPQPRGKQKLARGTIWYTAQSGIWQTVWMEVVPEAYIEHLHLDADADTGELYVIARIAGDSASIARMGSRSEITVLENVTPIAHLSTIVTDDGIEARLPISHPHLWSPDDPFLYEVRLTFGEDQVESYTAFRTFSIEADTAGKKRFCCNHQPLFLRGLLDQGYWSDGLLSAPSDEALIFDIQTAKGLGFNMLRKHIKVESERWYYHCDRLGMVVWQDMVSGGGPYVEKWTSKRPTLLPRTCSHTPDTGGYERFGSGDPDYREGWTAHALSTVEHLRDHPCIATWTIFNEAWGQFDATRVTDMFREADPTRPLDQASGWYDQGGGDYTSAHNYFRTLTVNGDRRKRASVISEFGGLAMHVSEHSAIERAYGYQTCETTAELQDAFDRLIAQADALEAKGLSGYVYTQLTDVEEEVNGLITYDRRLVKVKPRAQVNPDVGTDAGADAETDIEAGK